MKTTHHIGGLLIFVAFLVLIHTHRDPILATNTEYYAMGMFVGAIGVTVYTLYIVIGEISLLLWRHTKGTLKEVEPYFRCSPKAEAHSGLLMALLAFLHERIHITKFEAPTFGLSPETATALFSYIENILFLGFFVGLMVVALAVRRQDRYRKTVVAFNSELTEKLAKK